jgi:hypothetical protein
MTDRELLQMALDALESLQAWPETPENFKRFRAIEALRTALAQPEPEPVAWGVLDDDGQIDWTADYPFSDHPGWPNSAPLYTASPQREWVGLTDEEVSQMEKDYLWGGKAFNAELGYWAVYRAIEAKLKEKNNA